MHLLILLFLAVGLIVWIYTYLITHPLLALNLLATITVGYFLYKKEGFENLRSLANNPKEGLRAIGTQSKYLLAIFTVLFACIMPSNLYVRQERKEKPITIEQSFKNDCFLTYHAIQECATAGNIEQCVNIKRNSTGAGAYWLFYNICNNDGTYGK
jgi:hypothetical protein